MSRITREDITRLVEEYQALLELISGLQAQLAVVNDSLEELNSALNGLKSMDQQTERYVHIGAGIFLKAAVEAAEVLTPLGADYYAFLDIQNAERIINERINELNDAKARLEENLAKLSERAAQIRDVLIQLGVIR
ncbi:MAG: prefoldin subunit alpha [Thermoproteus sp. AZ2]|jgi:prefoldin alpha subunit|uniref:Prefoldin subunit alpha n=1 Tax=Thermoproteus sp. AZ2 TaxID=1609232 RepID=A0ACC6UZ09_9CREN|nr:MAG: prefoldin subunit alpha [Thermoproteus sp. AZ2]